MKKENLIISMLKEGCSYNEIVRTTGIPKTTVFFYAKKNGLTTGSEAYSVEIIKKVQDLLNEGFTYKDITLNTGVSKATLSAWSKQGKIKRTEYISNMSLDEILNKFMGFKIHSYYHKLIKRRLLLKGRDKCEMCYNSHWMNKPIVLELDHIDGNPRNQTYSNLRLLCPNCHSTTETWRGRNKNK